LLSTWRSVVLTRSRQHGNLPPRIRIDQRQLYISPDGSHRHRRGLVMPISEVDT
ncbi:Os03g0752000, partial [Oryza sativa Japonica Group]